MKKKEKKPDAWMPLWIGDYLADTTDLTDALHGNYLLLLMSYWRKRKPLPDDDGRLSTMARCSREDWPMRRAVLQAFFKVADGHWMHQRCEDELAEAFGRSSSAKAKAKKAADARWNATRNASSIAPAMLKECPSPSPILSTFGESIQGGDGASAPPPPQASPSPPPPEVPAAPAPVDKVVRSRRKAKAPQALVAMTTSLNGHGGDAVPVPLAPQLVLPRWMRPEAWEAFLAARESIRKKKGIPFTDGARKRFIEKCEQAHSEGYDVNRLVLEAADAGWRTIYPPERRGMPYGDRRGAEPTSRTVQAVTKLEEMKR